MHSKKNEDNDTRNCARVECRCSAGGHGDAGARPSSDYGAIDLALGQERLFWAEKYEGSLSEVLNLQGAIAKDVASEIQIKVTQRERTLLATARVIDPAAYEAYMKGRYLWERSGEENI